MLAIFFSLMISIVMVKIIIYTGDVHAQITLDHDTDGVQKMHEQPVPRVGGLAIFVSLCFTALYGANIGAAWAGFYAGIIASLFFVFVGGLTEDLSKAVSPAVRMSFMGFAVAFAVFVTHTMPLIRHLANPYINMIFSISIVAFVFTCFAVVGVSNAYNLVDGYNGLSSTAAMINVLGLVYMSLLLGDKTLVVVGLSLFCAIAGFWVFNYPRGKIFLGDGGAYSIGFMVALLSLNLIEKFPQHISPYSVLLLAIYPITETVFTIIRRKFVQKTRAMQPDNLHLHQLVFDRCLPRSLPMIKRNGLVMPIMLMFMLPQLFIVINFYQSNFMMLLGIAVYVIYYTYFYMRLVRFKTPKWMMVNKYKKS